MWAYNDLICPYLGVFNPIANISFIIDRVIHVIRFKLTMVYPSLSTWIGFPEQDELPYVLKPTTPVTGIIYDTDFGKPEYYEGDRRWQEWHGYGEYWEYAWEHDR